MPRLVKVASVSFDPEAYEQMEDRRRDLHMNRSEYVNRLILNDIAKRGEGLFLRSVPPGVSDAKDEQIIAAAKAEEEKARRDAEAEAQELIKKANEMMAKAEQLVKDPLSFRGRTARRR